MSVSKKNGQPRQVSFGGELGDAIEQYRVANGLADFAEAARELVRISITVAPADAVVEGRAAEEIWRLRRWLFGELNAWFAQINAQAKEKIEEVAEATRAGGA